MDSVKIFDFDYREHYFDLCSLFLRFYRVVNKEDLMGDEPVFTNGTWTSGRKLDNRINGLFLDGGRVKMAYLEGGPVGFLFYKTAFGGMFYGIDAMWLEPHARKTGAGRALINSLKNQYNQGVFEIYAQVHKDNPPELMLKSLHGWEEVRSCNDRDLFLIKSKWTVLEEDKDAVQEKPKPVRISYV